MLPKTNNPQNMRYRVHVGREFFYFNGVGITLSVAVTEVHGRNVPTQDSLMIPRPKATNDPLLLSISGPLKPLFWKWMENILEGQNDIRQVQIVAGYPYPRGDIYFTATISDAWPFEIRTSCKIEDGIVNLNETIGLHYRDFKIDMSPGGVLQIS
jgi:hypothetical protein